MLSLNCFLRLLNSCWFIHKIYTNMFFPSPFFMKGILIFDYLHNYGSRSSYLGCTANLLLFILPTNKILLLKTLTFSYVRIVEHKDTRVLWDVGLGQPYSGTTSLTFSLLYLWHLTSCSLHVSQILPRSSLFPIIPQPLIAGYSPFCKNWLYVLDSYLSKNHMLII